MRYMRKTGNLGVVHWRRSRSHVPVPPSARGAWPRDLAF